MKHQQKMVNFYFSQGEQYMSESSGTLISIKDMHPTYAANAARRILTDGYTWANDAGQDTKSYARWVLGSALFQALMAQATGSQGEATSVQAEVPLLVCYDCSFRTTDNDSAAVHAKAAEHTMYARS